ncbi:hypothetical protein K503DRAFT_312317 [Rhizopogon vinicolor AM-OR11-026]|uniref:Uncharacterized protein n=1 Tax=Rhizopogon vinicolor AM-OR11-026 TaxID=1314800 RepID=A0A1B7MUQ0_9AGAM|nr:hypothetical protein K503DRAFT_312317 [Rhizopogon vinicolor AM-OR11-026]
MSQEGHRDRDTLQQGQINEVRTQDQILTSSVFSTDLPRILAHFLLIKVWAHEKVKGQNCP